MHAAQFAEGQEMAKLRSNQHTLIRAALMLILVATVCWLFLFAGSQPMRVG